MNALTIILNQSIGMWTGLITRWVGVGVEIYRSDLKYEYVSYIIIHFGVYLVYLPTFLGIIVKNF